MYNRRGGVPQGVVKISAPAQHVPRADMADDVTIALTSEERWALRSVAAMLRRQYFSDQDVQRSAVASAWSSRDDILRVLQHFQPQISQNFHDGLSEAAGQIQEAGLTQTMFGMNEYMESGPPDQSQPGQNTFASTTERMDYNGIPLNSMALRDMETGGVGPPQNYHAPVNVPETVHPHPISAERRDGVDRSLWAYNGTAMQTTPQNIDPWLSDIPSVSPMASDTMTSQEYGVTTSLNGYNAAPVGTSYAPSGAAVTPAGRDGAQASSSTSPLSPIPLAEASRLIRCERISSQGMPCGSLVLPTVAAIAKHLATVHKLPRGNCGRCFWGTCKSTKDNWNLAGLARHIAGPHLGILKAQCSYCEKFLARSDIVSRHLEVAHGVPRQPRRSGV